MEDFKILLYVFGAIIFLVLWMWFKAFNSPSPSRQVSTSLPKTKPLVTPKLPSTSYQDILKEMQASGERAKQVYTPPTLEKDYTSENKGREAKSLEKTKAPAYSLESIPVLPKTKTRLPSTIELARQTKQTKPATTPQPVNYNRLLQDPQNVRTAFILSEILNRRFDY